MFETMIHSTEELNAMAVHLRLSENFSELKLLASEWLVPEEHVQDFIAGKRAQLAEIPFEEREYDSAVEKLRAEMWLIKDQMFTDIVSKYLIRKAEDNPVFGMQVLQKHKTIQKCMNYIMEQAYKIAKQEHEKKTSGKRPASGRNQNVALGISELQVYQWAEDYYALDDAKKEADSKISCTEMQLVKRLTIEQLLFEGLIYMVEHPERNWNGHVKKECGKAYNGFVVVRGKNPIASGNLGDILVLLQEEENCSAIEEVAFLKIDGSRCYPKIDYTVKGIANDQEEVCA